MVWSSQICGPYGRGHLEHEKVAAMNLARMILVVLIAAAVGALAHAQAPDDEADVVIPQRRYNGLDAGDEAYERAEADRQFHIAVQQHLNDDLLYESSGLGGPWYYGGWGGPYVTYGSGLDWYGQRQAPPALPHGRVFGWADVDDAPLGAQEDVELQEVVPAPARARRPAPRDVRREPVDDGSREF